MRYAVVLLALLAPASLASQVTRQNYYRYVPGMPKLVTQTEASNRLHLYGDRSAATYSDLDSDGIDDRRHRQLAALAYRFSPILRRNNFSFPRNFKQALGDGDVLMVDTWRAGTLKHSEEISLGWHSLIKAADGMELNAALTGLLIEHDPLGTDSRVIRVENYEEKVLFIDFPGHDPRSWRAAYVDADPAQATVYTHFFVHEDTAAVDGHQYYLVAQDWFFYPFNDATNNHEGDWEHINVLITTHAALAQDKAGRMTVTQIEELLNGGQQEVESTAIAVIDYYFHESVMTLDYATAQRSADASTPLTIWRDSTYIERTIRQRLTAARGLLATHPIGYIGGNNKGPDELLSLWPRFNGSYNRNGHGTYPFPGTWQSVGPLSSTEQLSGPAIPEFEDDTAPLLDRLTDDSFVVFAQENIIVVPDWERIQPMLAVSGRTQVDWSWLVLPMRWGFPVAGSPGGGAIAHVDMGNISPEGPTFQPTWNRVGTAAGWRQYDPKVFRVLLAPTTPWDKMKNGWGILNIPVGLFGLLPGWNVVVTQLAPWLSGTLHVLGAPPARTFSPDNRNVRFSSISSGYLRQFGGSEFALMLPDENSAPSARRVSAGDLRDAYSQMRQSSASTARYGIELHYGLKLSFENTYTQSERAVAATVRSPEGSDARMSGTVAVKDLTGGVRYAITSVAGGALQPFVRGGYGWTWYRLHHVVADDVKSDHAERGGYSVSLLPSRRWWPNTWYAGAGVEFFLPRRGWILPQLGYGLRAEVTGSRHRLGATRPGQRNLGVVSRGEFGISGVISW